MGRRPKHPNKAIEEAIQYAEHNGWKYVKSGNSSHAWGKLRCPVDSREGCQMSIWTTPQSPDNHKKLIIHSVDRCLRNCREEKKE